MNIFKLFKTKENNKQAELLNSFIRIEEKHVPVSDVLWACANGKKLNLDIYSLQNDHQTYLAQDHDVVDINGKTVSIGELKANYMMKTQVNEKKNCSCGTESETHKEDCTWFNKKNEKSDEEKKKDEEAKNAKDEEDKKNAKEDEDKKKKEDEAKNAKEAEDKDKKEKEEKENAKKTADEKEALEKKNAKDKEDNAFFNELHNAHATFVSEENESPAPMTRAERAKEFQNRTTKNKS